MSDLLSLDQAAREAPDAVALRIGADHYTFTELAELTAPRLAALAREQAPCPLVGSNTLDAVLTLYALLELGRPALLLHPRLTAAERAVKEQSTACSAASLPQDVAAILYTSGTTGRARGAVLARSALLASALASSANLGWQDDDCWLLAMPLARIGGLSIVTRSLIARKTVALVPSFDAMQLPQWLLDHCVTLLSVVPTMLTQVLDAHPDWQPPAHLRVVLLGGAAASPRLLERAAERSVPIVITYGCTETCSQVVATPYSQCFDTAACAAGRPLQGAELRVAEGHIHVRGPMLMAGYLGEPPLTAGSWFDTGDLGHVDDHGCVHIHARRSDLVVTGGENVYPSEVERALERCPGIREAGVFGVRDDVWGQTVAAALVATHAPPSDAILLRYLSERLAPHKRPRQIVFVPSLPQTPAGKLDRDGLQGLTPSLRPLRADTTVGVQSL